MHMKFLELKNYRNYDKLNLSLNKGLNIFVGENAQGKTNVVEAVYYLSTLRSHRTTKDKELINWDKEKAYIKGTIDKNYGSCTIEVLISSTDKKAVKINGVKISKASEVFGTLNVVMFSPEDLKLVKEGPMVRRKFIDNEINQIRPKYYYTLQQYNQVLMQRNNLLKSMLTSPSLRFTSEVFSEQLAEYGSFITEVRHEFVKKLSLISRLIHRKITNGREELEVTYQSDSGDFKDRKLTKDKLLKYYTEELDNDIRKGYTLKGPHRDDLMIKINGIDVRTFGSQGQQRTAALSLKLSELDIIKSEVGEYPVLILDDVLSELDVIRQQYLLDTLKSIQTILTCTSLNDINDFHFDEKNVFYVQEGNIKIDNK